MLRMGFRVLDDGKDDRDDVTEGSSHGHGSSIESPWLRKIDGHLQSTRRFQPGEHVLVRCNQGSWLRGWIKRHAKNGVGVWLVVSETLVSIPWELVSTHLMRLENYVSGANDNFYIRVHCVRPSHLSHRYLYERAVIVPCKRFSEEAVSRGPNPEQPKVFLGSDELMSCFNRDTFYPRRPTSSGAAATSKGFEPRILRETNPLCCGIKRDSVGIVERKADDDFQNEGSALCLSQESDAEYITAYDEAQDPEDEKSMDQIRENLYQKFLARRCMLLTPAKPDDNIPSSSASASPRPKTGWSLEYANLASKRDSLLSPDRHLPPTESTFYSDPYTKEDASQQSPYGLYPSKPRVHSDLHSMAECGNISETEASYRRRMAMTSS